MHYSDSIIIMISGSDIIIFLIINHGLICYHWLHYFTKQHFTVIDALTLVRGGKALTMTMTPWNLPHGQWSKKLTMTMTTLNLPCGQWSKLTNFDHLTMVILEFWRWSWSKMANFDHLTTEISKFWPWSWSKIFDHLTMTPGRRPNGQKIVVILPPPPLVTLPF